MVWLLSAASAWALACGSQRCTACCWRRTSRTAPRSSTCSTLSRRSLALPRRRTGRSNGSPGTHPGSPRAPPGSLLLTETCSQCCKTCCSPMRDCVVCSFHIVRDRLAAGCCTGALERLHGMRRRVLHEDASFLLFSDLLGCGTEVLRRMLCCERLTLDMHSLTHFCLGMLQLRQLRRATSRLCSGGGDLLLWQVTASCLPLEHRHTQSIRLLFAPLGSHIRCTSPPLLAIRPLAGAAFVQHGLIL